MKSIDDYLKAQAKEDALKWMDDTIALHERTAAELRRYRKDFEDSFDAPQSSFSGPTSVLGFFVNAAQNGVFRNMRLDLVADLGGKLGRFFSK